MIVQFLPWVTALISVYIWRKKLIGPASVWVAYPFALLTALVIAAVAGLIQFWIPQIEIGLGTKGLPVMVFLIVAYRATLPVLTCTALILIVLGVIKVFRGQKSVKKK